MCAGPPALAWSVRDLIHHRKNGHRISFFLLLLLLTDVIELFLRPYNISLMRSPPRRIGHVGFFIFMVVIKCLWSPLKPAGGARGNSLSKISTVFSSPCFIIVYILVFLCVFISAIILHPILIVPHVFIVSLITWIIPCIHVLLIVTLTHPGNQIIIFWLFFIYTLCNGLLIREDRRTKDEG